MNNQTAKRHSKNYGHAHSAKKGQSTDDSPRLLVMHTAKSFFITLSIGALLSLVSSLIAYFYADPSLLIPPLALLSSALTAFWGGWVAVRLHGHSALLCGTLNGALFTLLMILFSLFFRSYASGYAAWQSCFLHVGFFLLSIAGAYVGLHKKAGSPKKIRRR